MKSFALIPSMQNGILTTNAADLADAVRDELKKYNYIVTADTYKNAKEDRAKLNGIATQLASSRKHIENEVFGVWKDDKARIMGIEGEIKDAASALGEGIKAIDEDAKARKAETLEWQWKEAGGSLYPFSLVLGSHKSWMNKTAKKADIEAEMAQEIKELQAKEMTLKGQICDLKPEHGEIVMDKFYATLDLSKALRELERIEQILASTMAAQEQNARSQTDQKPDPIGSAGSRSTEPEQIYRRAFLVEGTRDEILALSQAMKTINIRILDIRGKGEKLPNKLMLQEGKD